MIRRPPRSTLSSSSAASDVYKRQILPEACRICKKHNHIGLDFFTWPEFHNLNELSPEMDDFWVIKPCENLESNDDYHCLPKDRAIIVLMDRLINMGNGSIYHE